MEFRLYQYFKNLNGLRFIAAFLVIIHHIEQFKNLWNIPNFYYKSSIKSLGDVGVTVFFVLSGFLITYILLKEKHKTGTINIISFYIKRILRIWPLYFLLMILGLFVFNKLPFANTEDLYVNFYEFFYIKLILYIFILPNIVLQLFGAVPLISQLWSIGIEEQFYLFWPHLIKRFKNTFLVILFVWLASFLGTLFIWYISVPERNYIQNNTLINCLNFIKIYLYNFKIHSMAIGAMGAYILFYSYESVLKIIYLKSSQIIIYLAAIIVIFAGLATTTLNEQIYSIIAILIILNLCSNSQSIFSLENKVFNFLGQISYGLYMFHPVSILLSKTILQMININTSDLIFNTLLYVFTFVFTIFISSISYYYFEIKFLKLKPKDN